MPRRNPDMTVIMFWNGSLLSPVRQIQIRVPPVNILPANHSAAPSLTNQSTITATSVCTSDPLPPWIHIKPELEEDTFLNIFSSDDGQLFIIDGGVISDKDEMIGEEHEEAVKSPPKGSGVHVGSEVSLSSLLPECCKLTV